MTLEPARLHNWRIRQVTGGHGVIDGGQSQAGPRIERSPSSPSRRTSKGNPGHTSPVASSAWDLPGHAARRASRALSWRSRARLTLLQRPPHGADSCASRRSRYSPGACPAMGATNHFVHGLRTSVITESQQWSHRPSAADRRLCCKALFVACPARSVFLTAPDELEHPGDMRSYPLSNQPRVYVSLRGVLPIPDFAFSCSTEKFDWCTDQHP